MHVTHDKRVLGKTLVLAEALRQGKSTTLAQSLRTELGQPKKKKIELYSGRKGEGNHLSERSLTVALALSLTVALA